MLLTLGVVALWSAACGDGATIDPPDSAAPADIRADAADTSADTIPVVTPELVFGTNVTGQNTPDTFEALDDNDTVDVEIGFQGAWMTVLAFKTRGIFTGLLYLEADVTVDGVEQGSLALRDQVMSSGGDGYDYYYNFFLIVREPTVVGGRTGAFRMLIRDELGVERTLERTLQLTVEEL